MKCPKCNTEYSCPCEACKVNFPKYKHWLIEDIDGDDWFEICPTCGFKESVHWWYDRQFN